MWIKLLRMARPQFLVAGFFLYMFGVCWAVLLGASFTLSRVLLGYLVLMPAHLSISYSNDYFDVDVDRHGKPTLFSGGSGILVNHPGVRIPARWVALSLVFCSLVLGTGYQILYSPSAWFLGLVLLGNLLGWFYSAPPFKLAYRGLGEPAMVLSIGLLIPGLGYLVGSGGFNLDGLFFTVPLMFYGLAFILTVESPDMESDLLGGKRTWVARKGRSFGFSLAGAALLLASLFFFIIPLLASRAYPVDFRILGLLSLLPLGAGCIGWFRRPVEKEPATRVVYAIMVSLAAFCLLADIYMLIQILRLG
jgi:1,4-dihydroxy-2-naphthoate octaprenyltransferase